ncbi:MAG: hypothetical protein ACK4PR_06745, partial [Gammaproteobacteria bacterium]
MPQKDEQSPNEKLKESIEDVQVEDLNKLIDCSDLNVQVKEEQVENLGNRLDDLDLSSSQDGSNSDGLSDYCFSTTEEDFIRYLSKDTSEDFTTNVELGKKAEDWFKALEEQNIDQIICQLDNFILEIKSHYKNMGVEIANINFDDIISVSMVAYLGMNETDIDTFNIEEEVNKDEDEEEVNKDENDIDNLDASEKEKFKEKAALKLVHLLDAIKKMQHKTKSCDAFGMLTPYFKEWTTYMEKMVVAVNKKLDIQPDKYKLSEKNCRLMERGLRKQADKIKNQIATHADA